MTDAITPCPWRIRWGTTAESTTHCDQPDHPLSLDHEGRGLFDGQRIHWIAGDRREYTGDWPGYCGLLPGAAFRGGCTLPAGHRGRCAPLCRRGGAGR